MQQEHAAAAAAAAAAYVLILAAGRMDGWAVWYGSMDAYCGMSQCMQMSLIIKAGVLSLRFSGGKHSSLCKSQTDHRLDSWNLDQAP